jgi:hypothetical protein
MSSLTLPAPRPKADDPPSYFPTTVGATAVYQTTIGDLKMEGTYRVTKVQKTREGMRVTVERGSGGKPAVVDQTDVSAKGLTLHQFGNQPIDPPTPVLRIPAKAGGTWDWEAAPADGVPQQKLKFRVVGEEEVEVPAGKFRAIRVEQEREVNRKTAPARFEEWYAPEVGLVKKVFHHLGATKQVQELKSFTPGKE